jgi:2-amino-4-hydroxy-6-hydroxymethyldihydropteridine diphosphokinase
MTAPGTPRQALIGAGANLGDRRATLETALEKLRALPGVAAVGRSSFYETDPVGYLDQPAFLNLVTGVETTLTPEALMAALLEIERQFGRVRTVRWGPRTIDLDLLAFEGETRAGPALTLPHPRLLERAFVTVPLRELLAGGRFHSTRWEHLRAQLGPAAADPAVRRLSDD